MRASHRPDALQRQDLREVRTETAPGVRGRRIAVVGSREYPRPDAVRQFVYEQERTTVIVSGGALGVDRVAVAEAQRLNMPYEEHLPDWQQHGKAAGPIRNRAIVLASDEVVAFWDGKSRGTAITIQLAREYGRPVRIFGLDGLLRRDDVATDSTK